MNWWRRLFESRQKGEPDQKPDSKWSGRYATAFCYSDEDKCRGAFERLRRGETNEPVPVNGRVEFRKATGFVPNKFWIVCINMAPGRWLDHVDVSDRYERCIDRFWSESNLLDGFDT